MLPSAVGKLLPTPRVASERTSRGALTRDGHWSAPGLAQAVEMAEGILPREYESWDEVQGNQAQDWREYEAAIRRQETAFGRPAPLPTEPGNKGQPRLSPRFVEWLMGLPDGWVTDVPGISRNDQLKALGNGVVPPQAAAATRAFLEDTMTEARTA
jgi:DNA (cytosine-5)-methyltransferase 1